MANRIWQYHFGRGIVPTPNEFGGLGEPATHPELLDWLASELIDGGWRMKRMHRTIVLSSAYQMSSRGGRIIARSRPVQSLVLAISDAPAHRRGSARFDPLGRGNAEPEGRRPAGTSPDPARGDGRSIRAGSGLAGFACGRSRARRSVFVHVKRSLLVPILATHDAADTDLSCPVRYTTTVPTQALGLLNGSFANEQAARFAERLTREAPEGLESQVRLALKLTTARKPNEHEVDEGRCLRE